MYHMFLLLANLPLHNNRAMIWSHHIIEIDYFWFCFLYEFIVCPPSIDPPSDISISRFSDRIPPWIHIWYGWIRGSPYILMTKLYHTIEPRSFEWMKSYFPIIFFWSSKINWVMSTIDISSPNDMFTTSLVDICLCSKTLIKSEFMLPCFLGFATIWEVDSIDVCDSDVKIEYCMNNSSFVLDGIIGKIMIDWYYLWCDAFVNPKSYTAVSCFFRWMIDRFIWCWME